MSETSSGPAILVEGLTKSFGDVHALRGIDLVVPRGTVLGVLGPNGAGKTTAVRILTTLLQPDKGRALVEGRDVVRQAAAVRRLIGLSGQSAAIQEELTGRENLEIVGRLYHLSKPDARAGPPICSSSSTWPMPPIGTPRTTRAACSAAWIWPPAWSDVRRCCSWTSRPPVWTRDRGSGCGTSSGRWSPAGRRCC